jgi:hypothetical protein
VTAVETRTDARRALLERLIDHAPLFPPASMSMEDALAEDARVRAADTGWIVGRFVCPASRLRDLGDFPLPLSVVVDIGPADVRLDRRIEAVEIPPTLDPDCGLEPPELYWEFPRDDMEYGVTECLDLGIRAKIRCGGVSVPSVDDLASVVRRCRELGVPFKATAGLHHAVRARGEHGFLNLLAAAVFGDERQALAEEDAGAFRLDERAFSWAARSAGAEEVARVRSCVFVGFGSCSVQEPVDDLRELGLI